MVDKSNVDKGNVAKSNGRQEQRSLKNAAAWRVRSTGDSVAQTPGSI